MSVLSQSRSTSNISRMRQLFETTTSSDQSCRPVPLSRCRSEVITTRGFKPSDIKDPVKTRILQDLTFKIWGRTMSEGISSDIPNGVAKPIDLQKLFTPADDAPEIQPRNKKMFASSSFYGPNHPTVEEQVELARRISSSLSDISNRESKGQSMYVNRKKRSVKWVHSAGEEKQQQQQGFSEFSEVSQSENFPPTPKVGDKPVLKLVMNPRGQVQDFSSLKGHVDATPSPEVCFDLVKDLNSPCGKGAELFAKRRKKAEKWVVDESNVKQSSHQELTSFESSSFSQVTNTSQLGKVVTPGLSSNLANLPTPTYLKDVPPRFGPQAVKNQIPEKYTQPKVRLIKSPWEAALEGSVEKAFQETQAAPSAAPRGTTLSKMTTSPAPQSYAPPADMFSSKPPKAWHPQPTGKQLSTVNLEKIFEGSPKSPVSLAYHADTNTLSSEPVPVENVPPFAVKQYDYEIIDPSIPREAPITRPDQVLAGAHPVREEPPKSPVGGWCPRGNQENYTIGSDASSVNPAYKLKHPHSLQFQPSQAVTIQAPKVTKQKVTWPPSLFLDEEECGEESHPVFIRQLSKSPQPQGPPQFPEVASVLGKQIEQMQQTTSREGPIQNTLQQSLSEIQTAMTQACQNFTRSDTGKLDSQMSHSSSLESFYRSKKSEVVEKETVFQSLHSNSIEQERAHQIQSVRLPPVDLVADNSYTSHVESVGVSEIDQVKSDLNSANSVQNQQRMDGQFSQETSKKAEICENISESITTCQGNSEISGTELHTESSVPTKLQLSMNGGMAHSESLNTIENVSKTEENIQSINSSVIKEESNSSQMTSQTHSVESFQANKQIQQSVSSINKASEFHTEHATNEIKQESYGSSQGLCSIQESQAMNTVGKTQFQSFQEKQFTESSNRTSMSLMSTTDEEVQDLFEREFNQISMQYEKMANSEIKKPAAIIPGAVKIFPPGNEVASVTQVDSSVGNDASLKKTYKKPASMVPGARPLFGEGVELQLGQVISEMDRPYEQIPIRNLIRNFEDGTRPFMKYNANTPPTSHFTNPPTVEDQMLQQSYVQQSSMEQQNNRTSLYSTFPLDDVPRERGETMSQLDLQQTSLPQQSTPAYTPNSFHVDLKVVSNFNTAPRGWQSNMSYYRPITFSTGPTNQFTDF